MNAFTKGGGNHRRLAATDPTGDFSDAKAIKKFGDVPDDLSAL
jgi:hypothetical protein